MARAYIPAVTNGEPEQGYAKAYGSLQVGEATRLGIEWYYDYGLRYPFPVLDQAEYVPFLWCDQYPALKWPPTTDYFERLTRLPSGYRGNLLFLNEPDLRGGDTDGWQCDRTPRQAAYIYKAARAQCSGCVFVGPAVSHEDYIHGWLWLRDFYNQLMGMGLPLPNVAAIHTYIGTEPPGRIVDSLFTVLAGYPNAPSTAWVTEFGVCDPAQARAMIEYYKSDTRVKRYAWFTAVGSPSACINLLNEQRQLTPVGEVYVSTAYP